MADSPLPPIINRHHLAKLKYKPEFLLLWLSFAAKIIPVENSRDSVLQYRLALYITIQSLNSNQIHRVDIHFCGKRQPMQYKFSLFFNFTKSWQLASICWAPWDSMVTPTNFIMTMTSLLSSAVTTSNYSTSDFMTTCLLVAVTPSNSPNFMTNNHPGLQLCGILFAVYLHTAENACAHSKGVLFTT